MTPAPDTGRTAEEMNGALAYLTPHRLTNGPVILDATKMRAAIEVLRSRLLQAEKSAEAMRGALDQAEACLSIVEPRSDKAEYLRTLGVVRAALTPNQEAGDA